MDKSRDYHTKQSNSERKTNTICYHLYVESNITKWIYLQSRNRLTDVENKFLATKGEGSRDELGVWD